MPKAPEFPPLPVPGFKAAGVACHIKKTGARDLVVIASDTPATVAGVFTTNVVQAAPVTVSRQVVAGGTCRAIVANAGNANCFGGPRSMDDARAMARLTARALGCPEDQVAVASTGVIGQYLPMDKVRNGIAQAVAALKPDGWEDAAQGIRTTDLVPKWHSAHGSVGGTAVTVTGITKGSGMIHPNMATMLGFLCTDAAVDRDALQAALARATERTFNRITVDGDTSTNDCVLALANGHAGNTPALQGSPEWEQFAALLEDVCGVLARAIAADGEGATKLVTVAVDGADSEADALAVARQIATSNLVKTALFAADPNWGRVLAAAGQAGVPFDPNRVVIRFDDACLFADGGWQGADAEKRVAEVMKRGAYTIAVSIGSGPARATVWTCDLSYDYVRINAEYRS
ncbi:MAG: bifunctional glutamate N-acetyltransferase/amino-acid acetyltransferase ArgJ [Nitrospirae bacterium]|nr:bifunctional glutamate N-acetyltransferase/amino-acid acetyltransferase ArgJ [Nitrospirota bacterium]